eukprot:3412561-Amphidinium_carterae.1
MNKTNKNTKWSSKEDLTPKRWYHLAYWCRPLQPAQTEKKMLRSTNTVQDTTNVFEQIKETTIRRHHFPQTSPQSRTSTIKLNIITDRLDILEKHFDDRPI